MTSASPLRLNLGSGDRHVATFVSVDIVLPFEMLTDVHPEPTPFVRADLTLPWPWAASSVDEIIAYDIVEHLPDRIHTMNEMWRVLKPGARATIETPNAAKGAGYFQDPTHQSPWCMNSFQYFEHESFAHIRFARSYGITAAFKVLKLSESVWHEKYEDTFKITAVLEAVK